MAFSNHVKVLFGADTKGFQKGLQKAQKQTEKFGDVFKNKFVGLLGAAAVAKTTTKIIEFGASIGDLSDRLGVGAEFLQKYQYAASQNGVASNEAGIALQRFTRRVAEAKDKGGPLADTLQKLGIQFNDSSGKAKNSEELFQEFGAALANMQDPALKLKTAFQFLDTEGAKLTQLFREGVPSIEEYGKEASKLGLIVENDQVKALQNASGAMEELSRSFMSFLASAAKPIEGAFKALSVVVKGSSRLLQENGTAIGVASAAALLYATRLKALKGALFVVKGVEALGSAAGLTGRSMKLLGGSIKALALGNFSKALRAAKLAVAALNITMLANPFVLFAAGVAAIFAPLILFKKQLSDTTAEMKKATAAAEIRLAGAIKALGSELQQAKVKTKELNQKLKDLRNLGREPIKVTFESQIGSLKEATKEIQKTQRLAREKVQALADEEEIMLKILDHRKVEGRSAVEIKKTEADLLALQKQKQAAIQEVLAAKIKEKENIFAIEQLEKKIAERELAKKEGLTEVLAGRHKERVELERQTEILAAMQTGQEGLLEKVKQRHEFEDKVKSLVKDGAMSLQEAIDLAQKRIAVDAQIEAKEASIKAEIDKQKLSKVGVNNEAVRAIQLAEAELLKHQANRAALNGQLAVMQLRAQGQNDMADALQRELDLKNQVKDIAEQLGIKEAAAVGVVQKKAFLENQIALNKLDAGAKEIADKQLAAMLEKDLADVKDRNERKRVRAAKHVERIDERILALQEKGGQNADAEIAKLEKVRNRQMEIVLDDQAKQAIEDIGGEKVKLQDQHKAHMDALDAKRQQLQKAEADAEAAQAKAKADLEAEKQKAKAGIEEDKKQGERAVKAAAEAQKKKVKETLDAGKEAIITAGQGVETAVEAMGNSITAKIEAIKVDPTDGATASGSNPVIVSIDNLAKIVATESTLLAINTTLKGKFTNQ